MSDFPVGLRWWHRVVQASRWFVMFYHQFNERRLTRYAASLAYATLLSIVPLMMVYFYVLSFFPVVKGTGKLLQEFVLANFVAGSAHVIAYHLSAFLEQIRKLSLPNIFGLFISSALLIYNMVLAFNHIWHTQLRRHVVLHFLGYALILILMPLLLGLLIWMGNYLLTAKWLLGGVGKAVVQRVGWLLPYFAAGLVFTLFNWLLPSCRVKLRYALVGGIMTAVLFEGVKVVFSLYFRYFPTYRLIYGAFAAIPIFLIWIYVSWIIILLGALVCCNVQSARHPPYVP